MVMHNRVRIQQECIEYICDILGPEVYEAFEGSGTRTRLQYALEKTQRDIYPLGKPGTIRIWWYHFLKYGETPAMSRRKEERWYKRRYQRLSNRGQWSQQHTNVLQKIVDEHPEFYVDEISLVFCLEMQESWSDSYLWTRLIGDCEYSLQRAAEKAYQIDEEERTEFCMKLLRHCMHPSELVFVDESQKDRNSSRRRRIWYKRGLSPFRKAIFSGNKGVRYTLLAACDWNGFIWEACETVRQKSSSGDADPTRGTIDGDRFLEWVRTKLVPTLGDHTLGQPRSIVVMDNATIHANPEMENLINSKGAILIKLPAYSPDLNPIELMFGEYKKYLKRHNSDPWDMAHENGLCCVSSDMVKAFFKKSTVPHCEDFPSTIQMKKIKEQDETNIMTVAIVAAVAIVVAID